MSSPTEAGRKPFQRVQYEFTRHIRDPEHAPAPGDIEDRRMGIYRDLLFNNVSDFMSSSFPVMRKLYTDAGWNDLIRDYFRSHRARTPLFPRMPQEFLHYLEHERDAHYADFPFLVELAHYEWIEMSLKFDPREFGLDGVDVGGDLMQGVPVLSPLALPLAYRFPVHRIGPAFMPETAPGEPTYLVVSRDRVDEVRFLELNPVSARLVELVGQAQRVCGRELLQRIGVELQHPRPEAVLDAGQGILADLRARDVILGTLID